MNNAPLSLVVLPQQLAVCRLEKTAQIPPWVLEESFFSITRTDDELSVVCSENLVPEGVTAEKNWRCFKVLGPLDFALTGILASLANALSEAKISIFAVSTYDTDYILVKSDQLEKAKQVLGTFCTINDLSETHR